MHLFLGKQTELDRQLTMLQDLDRRAFLYGSLQLHGEISRDLLDTAQRILDQTPVRSAADAPRDSLNATAFASRARREIAWYRRRFPDFDAKVRVTDDIYTGLLVSRGRLLVGRETGVPTRRADALVQHEVGTHLLTYFNGRAQPFQMLASGLPGYEELQEGLAVLSEYLVGGLTPGRLRVLAARVVAADAIVGGASFVDVFRLLQRAHGFPLRPAYTMTMRIFRGGGLVKDAVYLRGLLGILRQLAGGIDLKTLYIGKISAAHMAMVEELLHRRILQPTPIFPRYLESEGAQRRLTALQSAADVLELIEPRRRKTS